MLQRPLQLAVLPAETYDSCDRAAADSGQPVLFPHGGAMAMLVQRAVALWEAGQSFFASRPAGADATAAPAEAASASSAPAAGAAGDNAQQAAATQPSDGAGDAGLSAVPGALQGAKEPSSGDGAVGTATSGPADAGAAATHAEAADAG
jgi:hypothetical protein